jgi:signal transduction histidine kinase
VNVEKQILDLIQERPELQPPNAEITIQSPLPPMQAHEASLTQCLTNLLDNAVKFVAPGVKPRVRIWSAPIGGQVRLWIEDNGIGIEPAAQSKVFEMFHRLHGEREYEGTGIGLAIVRKAVERMNGQTGVESEPGRGSRFWLQLHRANL